MSNEGKKVKTHYRGTLADGTQFDSSYDRGEPLEFTCCAGMMIPGFDAAVKDMALGEKKDRHHSCGRGIRRIQPAGCSVCSGFSDSQCRNSFPWGRPYISRVPPARSRPRSPVDEEKAVFDMNQSLQAKI